MNARPLNDWILVQMDPIQQQIGQIFLPEGVDHRTATVLSTGPGKELPNGLREPTGVSPGDRVVFCRAHGEHRQGKTLRAVLDETGSQLLVKPTDILVVYEGKMQVS